MSFSKSIKYLERAKKVIPCQTQTFSKGPAYFPYPMAPVYLQRGHRAHIWDVDGNEYVDLIMGLGTVTLGYGYPEVDGAIRSQLKEGIIFSLPHPLEVELSEKLVDIIPSAEMVRFSKTGSEVCQAAIRAARAYTGRMGIAFRGYHGWGDFYAVISERPKGIPYDLKQFIHEFQYNDINSLQRFLDEHDIGAVIMEPTIIESPHDGFLQDVRELCDKRGAVLIWDEMVTGFRMALGGAQEYFGVTPDLAVFGKGIANGMPLAVVCGKREIMKEFEEVFFSTTFGGECLSIAAGMATIREMEEKDTIGYVWKLGERLINALEANGIETRGYPCRPMIVIPYKEYGDHAVDISVFVQECIRRGILIHSNLVLNLCYSHTEEDIDRAIMAFVGAMDAVKSGKKLEGQIVRSAFRRL